MSENTNFVRMRQAIKQTQAKLGITFTDSKVVAKDKDGNVILDENGKPKMHVISTLSNITDDARELMESLRDSVPCWFKGCDGLRKQYKEEMQNSTCKQCKGTILRKYMQLARHMLDADPDRKTPDLH